MRVLTKDEVFLDKRKLFKKIKEGAIFIYPTDTIYGIGCDATNSDAVKRIRVLKKRYAKPFSVIVPDIEWIQENCVVENDAKKWLIKLPGPYTVIFLLKQKKMVSAEVNSDLNSLGVRIPDHWISNFAKEFGRPIVTTSVNKSGELFASKLSEFQEFGADFIIFEGEKKNKPSAIVNLTKDGEVKKR